MVLGNAAILAKTANPQTPSLLFQLPAEIRHHIFCFALTDYPDPSPSKQYSSETCYARPSYFAPRKTDTALLLTCRAVYTECWFLPYLLREQTHWLAEGGRVPPGYRVFSGPDGLRKTLEHIVQFLGEEKPPALDELRVFAQMWVLEEGRLARLLATPYLALHRLVLTIRHTDWWFWENMEPLRFEAQWIEGVSRALPEGLRTFSIEIESLQQRQDQIDRIAQGMCQKWFFKTRGGTVYYADAKGATCAANRWSGSSTWHGKRWERDEAAPGRLDYYIQTVTFLPAHVLERRGGVISEQARKAAATDTFDKRAMRLTGLPGLSFDTDIASGENGYFPQNTADVWSDTEEEGEEEEDEEDEEGDPASNEEEDEN